MDASQERRAVLSWAFYDWANSAYAVTVLSVFFPLFFKQYWAAGLTAEQSTWQLGLSNSIASLCIVLLAPVLGSIADAAGSRKKFLFLFTFLGVCMCASLFLVEQGAWQLAVVCYIIASIGFSGGVTFSDSLIVHVSSRQRLDFNSALGYALGYLGGGIAFAFCVWMVQSPGLFGFAQEADAVRTAFLFVACWWAVFAIPVFVFVREPVALSPQKSILSSAINGLRRLRHTFRQIRQLKVVFTFLLAYWLYIDGVDTIVRMAVDYGMALGFDYNDLILALLVTQLIGFPAALAFGWFGQKVGPKPGIYTALVVYIACVLWAVQINAVWEFYALAVLIGLVQGGVQSLSRSLYARIIPSGSSAEFFGFYNMLGKFAAVLGPVMVGALVISTGSHRYAMLSIIALFVAGAWLLLKVDIAVGEQNAYEFDQKQRDEPF